MKKTIPITKRLACGGESHKDSLRRKGYMEGGAVHCDDAARSKEVKGGLAMTRAKARGKN